MSGFSSVMPSLVLKQINYHLLTGERRERYSKQFHNALSSEIRCMVCIEHTPTVHALLRETLRRESRVGALMKKKYGLPTLRYAEYQERPGTVVKVGHASLVKESPVMG